MSEEIKENIKAYYIGSDIDKVLDYIQQKENIIKEAREYIDENVFHSKNQDEQELYDIALLEILDKANDREDK